MARRLTDLGAESKPDSEDDDGFFRTPRPGIPSAVEKSPLYFLLGSACPLINATLGPISNMISICAIVDHWRTAIPPGKPITDGFEIQDTVWFVWR